MNLEEITLILFRTEQLWKKPPFNLEFYAYHFRNVMFMFLRKPQNFGQISLLIWNLLSKLLGDFVKLCGVHRKPSHGMASKTVLVEDLNLNIIYQTFIMVILYDLPNSPSSWKVFEKLRNSWETFVLWMRFLTLKFHLGGNIICYG